MKIIEKDILTIEEGIICHQVNCMGVMGGGLALAIRNKFPKVYESYKLLCDTTYKNNLFDLLGYVQFVAINDKLTIANIFGQYNYGVGQKHTEYAALVTACENIQESTKNLIPSCPIYVPYKMGSDRGGGDWNVVKSILESYLPNAIICKLPE